MCRQLAIVDFSIDGERFHGYTIPNNQNNLITILIERSRGTGPMTLQQPAMWSGANSSGSDRS